MGVGCSDAEVQSPCQPARMYEGVGGGAGRQPQCTAVNAFSFLNYRRCPRGEWGRVAGG